MKKEHRTNRRYSAEFKIRVILDMRNNHLTQKLMIGVLLTFCLHFAYISCKQIVSRESNHQP